MLTLLAMLGAVAGAQPATPAAAPTTAIVYVYRIGEFGGVALRPSVYVDDQELARVQSGKQFAVELPPGKNDFRSNDNTVVSITVAAGEVYFIRLDIVTGFSKGKGRLQFMDPEQGRKEIMKSRDPSDVDMVVDHKRVKLQRFSEPGK